tara:strand:+ start:13467 stop:15380 length:1914 start_codon:yes stop_codon:yes gene_type:complete
MMQFKGFKPDAMNRIAGSLGYTGDMNNFDQYLQGNPSAMQKMDSYRQAAMAMAKGGMVKKYNEGGDATGDDDDVTLPVEDTGKTVAEVTVDRLEDPTGSMPDSTVVDAVKVETNDNQTVGDTSGQVGEAETGTVSTVDTVSKIDAVDPRDPVKVEAVTTADKVDEESKVDVVEGEVSEGAKVTAEQQTESSVSDLEAEQGEAILMENPVQREIEDGELISGAANAEKAAKFTEEVQAATATPSEKATVQGQLGELTKDFDANNPPAWAAGALRGVMSKMASRGISASSMAGQAMVQAAMESALPIAQADASTFAQFEAQNLSNRQQRAMLAAQQRATFIGQEFDQAFQSRVMNASKVSDVANMNFTAEQTIALENSRIANTMNLANLNNKQAMVMAEAAALSNLDMANLSNRQQAAVQNAQNFMTMDMANLSNQQAANMFQAQSRVQSMFTDAAAENAANAFNATSENQTNQFYDSLSTQVNQFNSTQANAIAQYNSGQKNAMSQFNANVQNQREQFNSNNRLVVDQFNANWRRQVATVDNATVNRVNELNAKNALDVSNTAYNNMFSFYNDTMKWAFDASENEKDRIANLTMEEMRQKGYEDRADDANNSSWWSAAGSLVGNILMADADSIVGSWF